MPNKKAKKTRAATTPSAQATMVLNLCDGTREPIESKGSLIRIFDGFQNQLFDRHKKAPTIEFSLPFHDNLQDNYRVLVSGDGYEGAGFVPVKLSQKSDVVVDLMLLPKKADFKFLTWNAVKIQDPVIAGFLSTGRTDAETRTHYEELRDTKPSALASLLNLATAMKAIQLPSKTPLDYFTEVLRDDSLARDRFFGYADKSLVDQVRRAAEEGEFAREPGRGLFHPDATSSLKRVQFGEANVQLTFHEKDTKKIDGIDCIKVELDIDYFMDGGAHTLFEVIPNTITHGRTDPKKVYALRWIAGRHAGVPEFTPPYTIAV